MCYRKKEIHNEKFLELSNHLIKNSIKRDTLEPILEFYTTLDKKAEYGRINYPPELVSILYDSLAISGYVDNIIIAKDYQAHISALDSIIYHFGHQVTGLRILDLGCGTGVVSNYFKMCNLNLFITGVDISHNMLFIASQLQVNNSNVFNELINQDISVFTNTSYGKPYNLIILVDVLQYIGNFEQLIKNITKNHLSSNGIILLTIEFGENNQLYFIQDEIERFIFTEKFFLSVIKNCHLSVEYSIETKLRNNMHSLLIILKKDETKQ
ncbi:MAG: methyltransferase domain protein [Candidatus Xenolissoclinum pacificiensis L6]|uniref:Methyltransferase domain protein n=1 Tax=Candidatus Xenolissoclinum pacificiensis L6 TaxID=1401685 RepID=W2V0G7_9RICK|nr:MAG: methyltransferase domain protein [Candidatus Xenolissoclinum pacificiensis L6]